MPKTLTSHESGLTTAYIYLYYKFSLSFVAKLCSTLATPWIVACQAPLSVAFSRQEYWSGLPFRDATPKMAMEVLRDA